MPGWPSDHAPKIARSAFSGGVMSEYCERTKLAGTLLEGAGTRFDPTVVDAFLTIVNDDRSQEDIAADDLHPAAAHLRALLGSDAVVQ